MNAFDIFRKTLVGQGLSSRLRAGMIGKGVSIPGPFGPKPLIYADYVASGRALTQVENLINNHVLPFYANTHTEASFCGAYSTRLREAARVEIADLVGAETSHSVIFAGSGATAGINRLVALLDLPSLIHRGGRAVVLVGPYEHHSNILPWRESGAKVIEISESSSGGPDLFALEETLRAESEAAIVVGAFSAMSNVTGIVTDTDAVTACLKRYGALAIWDFAGGAPYMKMEMGRGRSAKDAIVFSPHKFPGGPGASGILVLRNEIVQRNRPTQAGGGTVQFVSPWGHHYLDNLVQREEAGTPNILGDIRAALVMMVKAALGQQWFDQRHTELRAQALGAWKNVRGLHLLGDQGLALAPIFSFQIRDEHDNLVHHQFVTRLLSDLHGIQARGGCACAGPYAHRLLQIGKATSNDLLRNILAGDEAQKPGWVRLNLSALHSEEEIRKIIKAVANLAKDAKIYAQDYDMEAWNARFHSIA